MGNFMNTVFTDFGAVTPLLNGADLMCAGIIKDRIDEFPENSPVCIMAIGKTLPYALGIAKISSKEILEVNCGVAVEILHRLGDGLWITEEI